MDIVDRSTVWPYDERGEPGAFTYQRYGHPAGAEVERLLSQLEGGDALVYGSGTSAITACVHAVCRPGTTVALAEGAYFGTGVALREFEPWGLRVLEYDQTGAPPQEADVVWVEAPANPLLTLPDWDAVRAHPGLVVGDATVATPIYLRALDEGADIVVHSGTKYLCGHSNALIGVTATRDPEHLRRLLEVRTRLGLTAAPDAAAALRSGLATLELRVRRQSATAAELARRLGMHPAVLRVRHPGLGGLVSFDVADGDERAVETGVKLIANQTSLGGVHSSIESRHRWEGDRIPRGLLRLSVGVEDVDELWADLERSLNRLAR
jgi:cystathionine gamma-synthase